jgi:hypothetical protein
LVPMWPGTRAIGMLRKPKPIEVAAACLTKPSQVREVVGKPATSHAALARNTAGVQLPQHAMPEMTALTPRSRSFFGSASSASFSIAPWVLPNSRQLTNSISG